MYEDRALITKVYDGDTLTADIDLGFGVVLRKQKLRIRGINAPEVRGKQRAAGLVTRDRLRDMVYNKAVIVRTHKDRKGKYGRWLADVYIDNVSVSETLLSEGLAVSYE